MSSPLKKQPEEVVDCVLKRAEVSKIARHLQNRLALAQFKAKHGWEDLTLDTIEPKYEEEMRRRRALEPDNHSDSSSSTASDMAYPFPGRNNGLMSSPLKAPLFSDAVGSSNGSSGHRKRTYLASFDNIANGNVFSSPSKKFRVSPIKHKSFSNGEVVGWKESHQLAQSSPIKPRRQQHFTTATGPDVSFFHNRHLTELTSPNFAAPSDDDDDLLPAHSFNVRSSPPPPRTPPMSTRSRRNKENSGKANGKTGEEGADLLIYLANSPSPAVKNGRKLMEPPSTPPQRGKNLDLPSSMMMTPGGGNLFPNTPGQGFDLADFVNITPSPAQKTWKTPGGPVAARTPMSQARRRLTFEEPHA